MRLAFISTMRGLPWGESEELWAAAAAHAVAAGHDVAAIVNWRPEIPGPLVRLADRGVNLVRARSPAGWRRLLPGQDRARSRALEEFGPDGVCISQPTAYESVLEIANRDILGWLRRTSTPYIVVCQSNTEGSPLEARSRQAAREFFGAAKRVVFMAERNRAAAGRHLAADLPHVILRNPVNITEGVPWPMPDDSGTLRLACVAPLATVTKGQDILLEALGAPAWQSRPWRLTVCGNGPDRGYLQDLARHRGLESKTEFAGPPGDVRALWAAHHALVLCSREEGTPAALVEAMLCARPAIVTDIGGSTEWVRDGENGYVAAAPTVREINGALERAWNSRARLAYLGLAARETALRVHDPNAGRTLADLVVSAAEM